MTVARREFRFRGCGPAYYAPRVRRFHPKAMAMPCCTAFFSWLSNERANLCQKAAGFKPAGPSASVTPGR